jgi:hypothetical protein
MSPLAMVFMLHGTFELVGGVYWGKSYSEVCSEHTYKSGTSSTTSTICCPRCVEITAL